MKKLTMLIFCFTIAFIMSFISYSAIASTAAATLQHKLNSLRTMSAGFSQTVRAKRRGVFSSSGNMALERPGKFRWDIKKPAAQLVVADGRRVWFYDASLAQVTVKKQSKGLGGTPALFLGGLSHINALTRDFTVNEFKQGKQELYDLRSKSAKDNFQHIKLSFIGNALQSIELFDQLGQYTKIQLSSVKINPKLASNLFSFVPPKGIDIIQQ